MDTRAVLRRDMRFHRGILVLLQDPCPYLECISNGTGNSLGLSNTFWLEGPRQGVCRILMSMWSYKAHSLGLHCLNARLIWGTLASDPLFWATWLSRYYIVLHYIKPYYAMLQWLLFLGYLEFPRMEFVVWASRKGFRMCCGMAEDDRI